MAPARRYVGSVSRGPEAVRLTGRDPVSGIDVALSIPIGGIEHVGVAEPVTVDGDQYVVLDLARSEAIELRPLGDIPDCTPNCSHGLSAH